MTEIFVPQYAYVISNIRSGKRYVGITQDAKQRWKAHRNVAMNGGAQLISKAIQKHGPDAFTFEVIACARTREQIAAVEVALIAQHGTFWGDGRGYNMTRGGEGAVGVIVPDSFREALSRRTKAMWENPEYRERFIATHVGRKRPAETCAKISSRCKEREITPERLTQLRVAGEKGRAVLAVPGEARERRAASIRKRGFSDLARERARAAALGRPIPTETRAKLSEATKGVPKSPETRERMKAAWEIRRAAGPSLLKGQPKSPETRARMSAAQLERRARERTS